MEASEPISKKAKKIYRDFEGEHEWTSIVLLSRQRNGAAAVREKHGTYIDSNYPHTWKRVFKDWCHDYDNGKRGRADFVRSATGGQSFNKLLNNRIKNQIKEDNKEADLSVLHALVHEVIASLPAADRMEQYNKLQSMDVSWAQRKCKSLNLPPKCASVKDAPKNLQESTLLFNLIENENTLLSESEDKYETRIYKKVKIERGVVTQQLSKLCVAEVEPVPSASMCCDASEKAQPRPRFASLWETDDLSIVPPVPSAVVAVPSSSSQTALRKRKAHRICGGPVTPVLVSPVPVSPPNLKSVVLLDSGSALQLDAEKQTVPSSQVLSPAASHPLVEKESALSSQAAPQTKTKTKKNAGSLHKTKFNKDSKVNSKAAVDIVAAMSPVVVNRVPVSLTGVNLKSPEVLDSNNAIIAPLPITTPSRTYEDAITATVRSMVASVKLVTASLLVSPSRTAVKQSTPALNSWA